MSGIAGTRLTPPPSAAAAPRVRESSVIGSLRASRTRSAARGARRRGRRAAHVRRRRHLLAADEIGKRQRPSSSSDTTTKPNIRKWSMTPRKGHPHVFEVAREGVLQIDVPTAATDDAAAAEQLPLEDGARGLDRRARVVEVLQRDHRVVADPDLAWIAGVDGRERAWALRPGPAFGGVDAFATLS